jgi:osmoprotectant transport system ATP-binding protein
VSAPAASKVLVAENLTVRFGTHVALLDLSIEVAHGECVALAGESGSGKTTLLRCFNCLVTPDAGQVFLRGEDLRAVDPVAVRRRTGYVPQDGGLLPHWTVRRNVALVPWLQGMGDPSALADAALELVGLDPSRFGPRWPRDLSGGERQRVAIARALAARPALVLLDEPFGALDALTRADLQSLFAQLQRDLGLTSVLVTHDLGEAHRLANRVAVLYQGRLQQVAPFETLRAEPATDYVRRLLERALL